MSVLFVDLLDFTALAEQADAEDVRDFLSAYFAAGRTAVGRYAGTVEKFIGDAVMAVWGTPTSYEDGAERAVRAGLEMLAEIGQLAPPGGTPRRVLSGRGAVTTGEAAVSLGAEGQGMVAGDLVNTAARLQHVAPAGSLLVDATTRRLCGAGITFEEFRPIRLRGKSVAVPAWRVVQARAERRRDAGGGPFVGRQAELDQALGVLRRTRADGRGRVIVLVGAAGIGKTRLITELRSRAAEAGLRFTWLIAPAAAHNDRSAYAPLAHVVRQRLGVPDQLTGSAVRAHVAAALNRLGIEAAEQKWLTAALGELLDPGGAVAMDRDALFAAWRRYLEREAEANPLVLVVEDTQWAATELHDFVAQLASPPSRTPMVVIAVVRPDAVDQGPGLARGRRTMRIDPRPLSAAEMADLVAHSAPDLPSSDRRRIVERANGVPLYAIELVRMLHGTTGAHSLGDRPLPETLHALISARIDQLSFEPRSLLLAAAVLGQRFDAPSLGAVSQASGFDESLALLVEREYVTAGTELPQGATSVGAGVGQTLSFVQDLVRDVAYRTLARRDRRALHLRAADHFARSGGVLVEPLAEHLWAAHRASTREPDSGEVARRAEQALRAAAAHADAAHAPARALQQLERALELVDPADRDRVAELHEAAAGVARRAARFEAGEGHLRQAVEQRVELGQYGQAARDRALLASLLLIGQRNRSALDELVKARRELAERQPQAGKDDQAIVELDVQLARAHAIVGDGEAAIAWADRAIAAAQVGQWQALAIEAAITRQTVRWMGGALDALAGLRQLVDQAASGGYHAAELRARNNHAWLALGDDPHESLRGAREGMKLAEQLGAAEWALQLANVAAAAAVEAGEWAWAEATLEEMTDEDLPPAYRADAAAMLTVLAALRGEEDAEGPIARLGRAERRLDRQQVGALDYGRATVAFCAGRFGDANALARQAARRGKGLDRFRALALAARSGLWGGDPGAVGRALSAIGRLGLQGRASAAMQLTLRAGLAGDDGKAGRATKAYRDALGLWRSLSLPVQLALCLAESEVRLGTPPGRLDDALMELHKRRAYGLVRLIDGHRRGST